MNMNYSVVWEDDGVSDRLQHIEHLFENAGEAVAVKANNKVSSATDLLSSSPYMGVEWSGKGRRLNIPALKISLFYSVDDEMKEVRISRMLHNSIRL